MFSGSGGKKKDEKTDVKGRFFSGGDDRSGNDRTKKQMEIRDTDNDFHPISMTPLKTGDIKGKRQSTMRIISKGVKTPVGLILLYVLGVLLFVAGITYFLFVFVLKKPIPFLTKKEIKYTLIISSKSNPAINKITAALKKQNYEFSSEKVRKFIKKKSGFQVIQKFESMEAARNYAGYLQKKKIPAKVVNDPEDGIYIQVWGVFADRKKAMAASQKASSVMKTSFVVSENFNKIPYTTFEVILKDLPDEAAVSNIKEIIAELKPHSVEIRKEEK